MHQPNDSAVAPSYRYDNHTRNAPLSDNLFDCRGRHDWLGVRRPARSLTGDRDANQDLDSIRESVLDRMERVTAW